MFLGNSVHTLDAKNRVCIPKRFQSVLERDEEGHRVTVLSRGFEGCLFLFPEKGFSEVVRRLKTQAFDGATARRMQRLFFANTHRAPLDGSGRVLIPDQLRGLVGIDKEVVLVGVIDRIEIWPRARWEAFEKESSGDFDALDRVLCGTDEADPAGEAP